MSDTKFTIEALQHEDTEEIYNHGAPLSEKTIEAFNQKLLERFGRGYKDQQLSRAIWAQGADAMMFACDQWHMKYLGAIKHFRETVGFLEVDRDNPAKRRYISMKKARGTVQNIDGTWVRNEKTLLLPKIKEETVEIGVPRFVIERLATPHELVGFHIPEDLIEQEWEDNRWLEPNDPANPTGQLVDVLGVFPANGQYVAFMYVENHIKLGDEVVGTEYRELEDAVLDEVEEEWDKFLRWQETSVEQRVIDAEYKAEQAQYGLIDKAYDEVTDEIRDKLLGKIQVGYGSKALPLKPLNERALDNVKAVFGINKDSAELASSAAMENQNANNS